MKLKDFPKHIVDNAVDFSVNQIRHIIDTFGPRESGNENCLKAQEHLKETLSSVADDVYYEEYRMAPKAFLHFTKTVGVAVSAAVLLGAVLGFLKITNSFLIPQLIVAVICIGSLFVTVMEFLLYKRFCDVFYKKITGRNLLAVRKSSGETKRRIIISGHIDAAYEWRHIYYGKGPAMGLLMGGSIISSIVTAVLSVLSVIFIAADKTGGFAGFVVSYSYYFHFFTLLNMITLFLFVNFKTISPGANDNLTGTMAAVSALKMLDDADIRFENTEVCCIVTDGEEAGLRGCKQLAADHYKDYMESGVETAILCVDTLTDFEYLNVYVRDMTGTVKHDPAFCQLVMDSAKEAGYDKMKFASVFFGSSDAAAFSQAGITAAALAAMDPTPADYYHNRRDHHDRLVPKTIKAGYEIILSTILNFDEKGAR